MEESKTNNDMTASLFTATDSFLWDLEMADMSDDQLIAVVRGLYHTAPHAKVRAMVEELHHRFGFDVANHVIGTAHLNR